MVCVRELRVRAPVESDTVEGHTHTHTHTHIYAHTHTHTHGWRTSCHARTDKMRVCSAARLQASSHRRTAMRHEHLGPVTESDISDRVSLGSTCANSEQTPRTCRAARTRSGQSPEHIGGCDVLCIYIYIFIYGPTISGSASSCSRSVQCCTSYCIGICPYCSLSVLIVVIARDFGGNQNK